MFTNLIESNSHTGEFKRRSSFFLITVAGYALILFAAGIVGVLTYDAHVEAQNTDLLVDYWIPPVRPVTPDRPLPPRSLRSTARPNAPVDQHITTPERTDAIAPTTDPTKVPDTVGIKGSDTPPVTGPVVISNRNADPPAAPSDAGATCSSCPLSATPPVVTTPPPTPIPRPPTTETLPSRILVSKAVNLPQPPYPLIAKQTRTQGAVNVQILIDENGRVISAHAVAGNAMLAHAAEEAALRARFTPTILNNQPVKVQGVITYNFVLQ
jgi:periplasmic protein TonB